MFQQKNSKETGFVNGLEYHKSIYPVDIVEKNIKTFIWNNKQQLVNKTTSYLRVPLGMGGLCISKFN